VTTTITADQSSSSPITGQQEVGVRLGKVVEFLDRRAQPHAEQFAPPEGDQRVGQLVALVQRGAGVEGIEVGEDAGAPPGRQHDDRGERDASERDQAGELPAVHAAEEQHTHRDRRDHHECAEIGLEQQQQADHEDRHRPSAGSPS
jgi:hypothetical protein